MKNLPRFSAGVAMVAALLGAATIAKADTYTITNQTFESIAIGSLATPAFTSVPITVAYGQYDSIQNVWELDTSFPLTVESNNGNHVLGDGQGPILFSLSPNITFNTFVVNAVATGSPFASATATGFFQSATGVSLGSFTFNQLTTSTQTLNIPAGTSAIILPSDSQYDNLSLNAVTVVPEAGTLPFVLIGCVGAGLVIVRRKNG